MAWKQVCSLAVKALEYPPRRSNSLAISRAERLFVPLKSMCSMKWVSPASSGASSRLPTFSQNPTETVGKASISSVITRRPFSSVVFLNLARMALK